MGMEPPHAAVPANPSGRSLSQPHQQRPNPEPETSARQRHHTPHPHHRRPRQTARTCPKPPAATATGTATDRPVAPPDSPPGISSLRQITVAEPADSPTTCHAGDNGRGKEPGSTFSGKENNSNGSNRAATRSFGGGRPCASRAEAHTKSTGRSCRHRDCGRRAGDEPQPPPTHPHTNPPTHHQSDMSSLERRVHM